MFSQKTFLKFFLCIFSLFAICIYSFGVDSRTDTSNTLTFYLTIAESDLYDETTGIIANYEQRGDESERPVHVKVCDADGTIVLEQDAGIRVVGQTSRAMPKKSFKLTARRSYDPEHGKFEYDFFKTDYTFGNSSKGIQKYNSILLRSISYGHDTTGSLTLAGYSLARQAGLEGTPQAVPAKVYINQEYYGTCILTQAQTASTIAEMFHIEDKESVVITEKGTNQKLNADVFPEDVADYYDFNQKVISAEELSPELLEEISEKLDIDQFFTYIAVETLLGNADWPHNNFKIWRCDGDGSYCQDNKWRYLVYDLDLIGCEANILMERLDSLYFGTSSSYILPQLMKDPSMRMRLANIYRTLLRSTFSEKNIRATFEAAEKQVAADLNTYLSSENYEEYLLNNPQLISSWTEESRQEYLETTIQNICNNRQLISNYFHDHFGISLLN